MMNCKIHSYYTDLKLTDGEISWKELDAAFRAKYGDPETVGWAPRRRHRHRYATPDDIYETVVARLLRDGDAWADVGCGREVFPSNPTLASALASRSRLLVGIDPDETILENSIVHEQARSTIEDYRNDHPFDLITMRMVAEHINDPAAAVASLARLTAAGSKVVVYTVNRWSPVALAAQAIPFWLHPPIKRALWKTEERDTFPVAYRMNTRRKLSQVFHREGFEERSFIYLDDCRTFGRLRIPNLLELTLWRVLHSLRIRYPENCLLGLYERV
jgi:SAM-dependent methyltransferase